MSEQSAAVAGYTIMLQNWGIHVDAQVKNFIQHAVGQKWSTNEFLMNVRKTKFYARAFPGLVKPNGSTRNGMTEAQYMSYYNQLRDYAASIGQHLSKDMVGTLIKGNNSLTEAKEKIDALDKMREYKPILDSFAEYLRATGKAKKFGPKERMDFILRQGPREWEKEWDAAYTTAQLSAAGIDVGKPKKGSDLSFKQLNKILGEAKALGGIDPSKFTAADYQNLANNLSMIPTADLYGMGVTKKDIVALQFGTKGSRETLGKLQRAAAQYSARLDQNAPEATGVRVAPRTRSPVTE